MKTLMMKTERLFATTRTEAESIVEEAKQEHGNYLKQHIIAKRVKRDVEYFIVTITVEYYKANELVITE